MGSSIEPTFFTSLVSGGVAGLSVDVALFPLDTLKTRLQSPIGFLKSGGFNNVYKGLGVAAIGSAPNAAMFFCTYNSIKKYLKPRVTEKYEPVLHMFAASMGELAACICKVPVEVVKQRQQASTKQLSGLTLVTQAYNSEGIRGLFRGFQSTVLREVPFSIIQIPIWEWLMKQVRVSRNRDLNALEVSACGAVAGAISGAVTTPLDVAKTRIMLAEHQNYEKLQISTMLATVYREGGIKGLFAGFVPRVVWITIGGAVFFGVYGATRDLLVVLQT